MNQVMETLLAHKSVRKFEDKPLTSEQVKAIVTSAQAASTSSFIQAYSIIGVSDPEKKRHLAEVAGNQAYVEKNGHFFVFCADLHRHELIGELENKDVTESLQSTERFMIALIDTALAAQNAAIAAESMGLGICFIGGIRNNLEKVSELLKTPAYVLPLFGIAVGYPDRSREGSPKPRLPFEHIYHENEYSRDKQLFEKQLGEYNEIISAYYDKRTVGKRKDTWTGQMANMLETPRRKYMKEFVEQKFFDLK
ncbi:oxygen-insensitive NADPH nitroreductase [Bacillaceae bacterium Marseille-Q3522]|nr:oxygen-insensitive NADPH nitroreductase [Bacillaceae bacterium Marseille-Q3522]